MSGPTPHNFTEIRLSSNERQQSIGPSPLVWQALQEERNYWRERAVYAESKLLEIRSELASIRMSLSGDRK